VRAPQGEGGYHGSCSSSRSRGSGPRHHHGHGHHHAGADAYDAPGGGGGGAYGSGGGHHMLDRRPRSDSFRGPPGGVLGGGGGPAGAHHHALRGGGHSSSGRLELDMCGMGPGGAGAGVPGGRSVDPLLEEYKTNRTRKWEMRVRVGAGWQRGRMHAVAAACAPWGVRRAVWWLWRGTTRLPPPGAAPRSRPGLPPHMHTHPHTTRTPLAHTRARAGHPGPHPGVQFGPAGVPLHPAAPGQVRALPSGAGVRVSHVVP
jgi:hypothetical protein